MPRFGVALGLAVGTGIGELVAVVESTGREGVTTALEATTRGAADRAAGATGRDTIADALDFDCRARAPVGGVAPNDCGPLFVSVSVGGPGTLAVCLTWAVGPSAG